MPSGWLIEPETAEGEGEGGTVITYVVQMKVRRPSAVPSTAPTR